jgi:RNA polymerase sigma-70 factor (ECF subfamily)
MRRDRGDAAERMRAAFEASAADLLAYAERRVLPREDAADVISEAMVVAWRKVAALPADPQAARMWLFAIVKNTLLNHRRGARRRDDAVENLKAVIRADVAAGSHEGLEQLDRELQVRAALAAIPADAAELIRLVFWDGFSLAEAAQLQKLPASTVRSRYARARELLAQQLADSPVDELLKAVGL